jgi:hypothetical protein
MKQQLFLLTSLILSSAVSAQEGNSSDCISTTLLPTITLRGPDGDLPNTTPTSIPGLPGSSDPETVPTAGAPGLSGSGSVFGLTGLLCVVAAVI